MSGEPSSKQKRNTKWKPGESGNPKGRPKGSKDKFTSLKDAFLGAFVELGGMGGLVKWANASAANRRAFYQMICKMLPTNIDIDARAVVDHLLSFKFSENGNGDSNGKDK